MIFFSSLYSPVPEYDSEAMCSLLAGLPIPKLTVQDCNILEAKITVKEIQAAIFAFPPNKAPGPDGFPIDFYRANVEQLAIRLNGFLGYCLDNSSLPNSMLEAYMILLLKPGKDLTDCASYRSIALLNTDLKILTKLLATRLATVIPSIVNIDQMGFMLGKSTDTNLRRFFTHMQLPPPESDTRIVVSIDIEKTFDSVDWNYMFRVLEIMGFGPQFRKWISMLYRNPKVAIRLGSAVSEYFEVGRGTRQGCPLSPFLFALVMEPLAVALRSSGDVWVIKVGTIHETLALYADDMLLFLNDPGDSLRAVLDILNKFALF